MTWPKTEADLASVIDRYLEAMGWDRYYEVTGRNFDARADIVATRGRVVWVIETKRSLSLALLAQASRWRGHAHMVSVAVPRGRRSDARLWAERAAGLDGIGVLEAKPVFDGHRVGERVRPVFTRRTSGRLRRALRPEQKHYVPPGSATGRYWSPFLATCKEVRAAVERTPGLTIRQIVDSVAHHYASAASARGSLKAWADAGKLEGVEVRYYATGPCLLFPTGMEGPARNG